MAIDSHARHRKVLQPCTYMHATWPDAVQLRIGISARTTSQAVWQAKLLIMTTMQGGPGLNDISSSRNLAKQPPALGSHLIGCHLTDPGIEVGSDISVEGLQILVGPDRCWPACYRDMVLQAQLLHCSSKPHGLASMAHKWPQ